MNTTVRSCFTLLLFIFITSPALAQEDAEFYKGGKDAFYDVVRQNLRYPVVARREGREGKVIFKLKVSSGNLDSVTVLNSLGADIDAEALRVLLMTNGNWLGSDQFLVPIVFVMDYPGRISNEQLIKKREKALKREDFSDALTFSEELRRRDPLNMENLDKLVMIHTKLGDDEKSRGIVYLKNQFETVKFMSGIKQF